MDVDEREQYVEDVLSLVERIPTGRVMSYGAIADHLGRCGPRRVGHVLATDGAGVPWWRVVRTDGSLPRSHERRALEHYRVEGTPLRGAATGSAGATRVDIARAAWSPGGV
ncbi:MAG: MGMT family protein [Actinomycetota bacterium]|nr:MGMT family protein [Actinomycetota bacterium]MDQ3628382.1 MGMT family protein [Actinomycetota bacterium]